MSKNPNAGTRAQVEDPHTNLPNAVLPPSVSDLKPIETVRVGDMVLLCYRGSLQLYPAWVTSIRGSGGRDKHALTVTMLWDKGSGCAIVNDPVHIRERRGGERESWWIMPDEDPEFGN